MKKLIPNYSNYQIDDEGNVYNTKTKIMLKGSIGENGYKYYRLSKNNKKKMFYAHRLVAEAFIDNPNNLPVVNHIDGNKLNNKVDNLEWVSYSENTKLWHQNQNSNYRRPLEYYKEDLPNEIWKQYKNYYVSSLGRIRHIVKNNLLRPSLTCGYYKVRLSENGMTQDIMIHKLVWQIFDGRDIPENYVIDHIDGNKLNNSIDNLRLLSLQDNVLSALYFQKTNKTAKRVGQYSKNGEFIKEFLSAAAAARELGLDPSTITKVCRGKNKSHGGFVFKYLD